VDVPGDLYALLPDGGIKEERLAALAFKEHGYYKDEVALAVASLISEKKIEERPGEGQAWRAKGLFKVEGEPQGGAEGGEADLKEGKIKI
jgi:hypothetical protein